MRRIHQAQGRGRDHGLLDGQAGVAHREREVLIGTLLVPEGPPGQPRHPPDVAGRERDLDPSGACWRGRGRRRSRSCGTSAARRR